MHRGQGVETATLVGISELVDVTHEYDECSDEMSLIFRGNGELVLSCTRRGFDVLREAVADANRDLITRSA
ncbi:hypothetical protein ABT324_29340 [Saccharopolyspora sp. NPDC000359]|uniref:hypothetical protein n=1 Tax=Saccharopolyspora sp. NPDC000359 TaxID=3154251 RepID=UPI0033264CBE